jgi:tRNA(Ile)-lysidine synthase
VSNRDTVIPAQAGILSLEQNKDSRIRGNDKIDNSVNNKFSPITFPEFSGWMAQLIELKAHEKIALAVSGGADSMALLLLANAWAKEKNIKITAVTINHNLRADAKNEAQQVAIWCAEKKINHQIINWDFTEKPISAIQEKARNARYQLLTDFCKKNAIKNLLVAHHGDDQIETFFFRLARGSGLLGLAGMSAKTEISGVNLLRPLLLAPKTRLIATLREQNQPWIEDPSNQNTNYTRVRIRQNLKDFLSDEENRARTMKLIQNFGKFRMVMEKQITDELANSVEISSENSAILDMREKISEPALSHLVKILSGKEQAPRTEKMQHFYQKLYENSGKKLSFNGLLFKPTKDNKIIIYHEKESAKNIKFSAKLLAASGFWSMNSANNTREGE